jgi:thiosulfate reductase cytochrome b subunit
MSARAEAASRAATPARPIRIAFKHHALVRLTHWLNVPLLLGMIVSGLAIYWAAPVFEHAPDPATGNTDYFADLGAWVVQHVPGASGYARPATWIYDHFSIGPGQLALALRLHWFFAYLFMVNGVLYAVGLLAGGGFRGLLPRRKDVRDSLAMMRYYLGVLPARLLRRPWPHPVVTTKYNALQRSAYFAMPVLGLLAVLSGWAMHKPVQLHWLERMFVNYNGARIVHFGVMCALAAFVLPHVVLVIADGWDTLRSMVTGWSARGEEGRPGKP